MASTGLIRLSKASVSDAELEAVRDVFTRTVNFGLGVHVQEFETKVKEFLETDHEVIAVNTGTAALHAALVGLDLPAGGEVIVPSITFVASHSAISAAGLKPISCEVLFPSCHLDPADVARRVTPNTVAIMPVAYAGVDFDRKAIYQIATSHNLRVIEDDAHAFGSRTQSGRKFGSEGDVICFSFDSIKNITTGEGGAVLVRDKDLAHKLRVLRALGIEKDVHLRYLGQRAWDFDVATQGFRYHMSNINAAIGVAQLKRWPELQERKLAHWRFYLEAIKNMGLGELVRPTQVYAQTVCLHLFNVVLADSLDREPIRVKMREMAIETGFHYAPNHLHSMYKSSYALPVAERLGKSLLSLPMHPDLTQDDIERVLNSLKSIIA